MYKIPRSNSVVFIR